VEYCVRLCLWSENKTAEVTYRTVMEHSIVASRSFLILGRIGRNFVVLYYFKLAGMLPLRFFTRSKGFAMAA